jgi:Uma2 family endonuclease
MDVDRSLAVAAPRPPPNPLSYEQFLEWSDETWAEWIDGRVILLPMSVSERHAAILALLMLLFKLATHSGRLGSVYAEPFQMRLSSLRRGRSPDLIFVRTERRHLLRAQYLDGPADIVVEIVSPESVQRDRVEKLAEYERAGVPEYWLIDAESPHAEIRELGPDGRYRVAFAGGSGLYRSAALPQLRLRLEWLWQPSEPSLDELLTLLELR